MGALTEKRILGIRSGDQVLVPPMEWDPATGDPLPLDLVEVGPAGTVESWTRVPQASVQHPLDEPFAFAFIKLDGATTPLLHAIDAGAPANLRVGMRVAPRWKCSPSRKRRPSGHGSPSSLATRSFPMRGRPEAPCARNVSKTP